MREYYIRREGDEDASGPFDIDQISSLIEADKLDATAYYYDIETESWLLISSNQEMMDTLFPKKRKLSLRTAEVEAEQKRLAEEAAAKAAEEAEAAEDEAQASPGDDAGGSDDGEAKKPKPAKENKPQQDSKKKDKKKLKTEKPEEPERLDVTRMMAIAEGRANDPSGKSPREKQAAVAFFGLRFLTLFFVASVLAMAFIERDLIMSADAIRMAKSPYLLVAAFDLVVSVTLLLQVTEVYPLLRFRAALGAGLLTLLFYASGDPVLLVSNLLLMAAVYFTSAVIKIRFLIVCAATGVVGILGYVYGLLLS